MGLIVRKLIVFLCFGYNSLFACYCLDWADLCFTELAGGVLLYKLV